FNHRPPSRTYTLSLHDALPIFDAAHRVAVAVGIHPQYAVFEYAELARTRAGNIEGCRTAVGGRAVASELQARRNGQRELHGPLIDRKSTRLNSSHLGISYAVFC